MTFWRTMIAPNCTIDAASLRCVSIVTSCASIRGGSGAGARRGSRGRGRARGSRDGRGDRCGGRDGRRGCDGDDGIRGWGWVPSWWGCGRRQLPLDSVLKTVRAAKHQQHLYVSSKNT